MPLGSCLSLGVLPLANPLALVAPYKATQFLVGQVGAVLCGVERVFARPGVRSHFGSVWLSRAEGGRTKQGSTWAQRPDAQQLEANVLDTSEFYVHCQRRNSDQQSEDASKLT